MFAMTRGVLISISGSQCTNGEPEEIEMMVTGDYYEKNGKRYVVYEEIMGTERSLYLKKSPCVSNARSGMFANKITGTAKTQMRFFRSTGKIICESAWKMRYCFR